MHRLRAILRALFIAAVYVASLRLGVEFKDPVSRLSAIWPASGVALAILLLRPRKEWPWLTLLLAATGFAYNAWFWHSWSLATLFLAANVLEFTGIAAAFTWRSHGTVDFRRMSDTVRLLGLAVVLELIPAFFAGSALHVLRGSDFPRVATGWWASNALGMIVVTPLVVTWMRLPSRGKTDIRAIAEITCFGLGWIATTMLVFSSATGEFSGVMHPYMLLPMLVWAALRFGVRGVTASMLVVTTVATVSALSGGPMPLGGQNPQMRLLIVQLYVAIAQCTGLLLAGARAELVAAERVSRNAADRLKRALSAARMGTWEWDLRTGAVEWSDEVVSIFGVESPGADRGLEWYFDWVHPEDKPGLIAAIQTGIAGAESCRNEHRFQLPTGEVRWVEVRGRVTRDRNGQPMRMVGTAIDATSKRAARMEIAAREKLLHQLIRHTPAAVAMFDCGMNYLEVSENWIKDYRLGDQQLIGRCHYDVFPNLPPKWKAAHARVLAGGPVERCDEDDFVQPDGSTWWLQWEIRPWHRSNGEIGGITMFTQVITDRKNAEIALRRQRRRADAIIQAAMDGIVTVDELGQIQTFNPAAERMFRMLSTDALGEPIDRFLPDPVAKGGRGGSLVKKFTKIRSRNEISGAFGEVVGRRADGVEFPVEAFLSHTDLDGVPLLTITLRDLTERMASERALRESEERFRQVVENIQEVFWMSDATRTRLLYVSPAYEKIFGRTCESLHRAPEAWLEAVHPDDRERVSRAASLRLMRGDYHEEYRILRPDGAVRWVSERAMPVRSVNGTVYRLVGIAEDVTERRRIEDQFRQAQKMEAIGQLAGGVAHDFNNILGAIMMAAGEAEHVDGLPDEARELMTDVVSSAERAANLTRQLLLFSRRQVMEPRELDLNSVVGNVARMLRRIVGEDIQITMRLNASPLNVQADAGMLEQILVNLAVNARDAMPAGGELVIDTTAVVVSEEDAASVEDAASGPHVRLRVRDTGTGISPELLNRIFEPFFTTKEPGRGTGLGLATVFGIVKQHKGWITVDSTPGTGTTFEVYFPRATVSESKVGRISESKAARGGSETILLVEDDPDVRKFARMVLQRAGYAVVDASSGVEAEVLFGESEDRIDLLLTDMVMPDGINGRELARRLRLRDSSLRVIVTSGYSEEFAGRSVGTDVGDAFLSKPWKPQQMLEAIRRCLDASRN